MRASLLALAKSIYYAFHAPTKSCWCFFQTQRKRRRQIPEMEWLGEEEYNPGVPVWRGEVQVRMSYFNALKSNDLDIHLDSSE